MKKKKTKKMSHDQASRQIKNPYPFLAQLCKKKNLSLWLDNVEISLTTNNGPLKLALVLQDIMNM